MEVAGPSVADVVKAGGDGQAAVALVGETEATVVVGGGGAREDLWNNRTLFNILNAHHAAGKPVAAICIAPVVLARAGSPVRADRGG